MEKINTAIVTGPTGAIGLALVRLLSEKTIETYAVCHPGSDRNDTLPKNQYVHKVFCNLEDLKDLPDMIGTGADAFFHLAWKGTGNRTNRMDMYLQNDNVKYALDSVLVADILGCRVYVGAGSQAEFGNVEGVLHSDMPEHPVTGYGMGKLCAGQMTQVMCKERGIRHIWPRIVSVYGPGDGSGTLISTVINSLNEHRIPKLTAGEQIWDYLYSGDAAEALLRMAESGQDGAKYVLGSGQTRTLREYVESIRDSINSDAKLGIGKIPYLPNQVMHLEADISDLTADTGWKPETTFEEGIRKTIGEING
ncbi:MAG: NAD(P)-dependent oxidoreductase [Lachnospiraceae bacterium]|nr:NAD(P)-dependent oxidoreductase [Lachnospiraceae bacterium]